MCSCPPLYDMDIAGYREVSHNYHNSAPIGCIYNTNMIYDHTTAHLLVKRDIMTKLPISYFGHA